VYTLARTLRGTMRAIRKSIQVSEVVHNLVREEAAKTNRTVGQMITWILREYFKNPRLRAKARE
jgi:hypothetical protein